MQQDAQAAHHIQNSSTTHATAATTAPDRHCCRTQALKPIQKSKHTPCQPHSSRADTDCAALPSNAPPATSSPQHYSRAPMLGHQLCCKSSAAKHSTAGCTRAHCSCTACCSPENLAQLALLLLREQQAWLIITLLPLLVLRLLVQRAVPPCIAAAAAAAAAPADTKGWPSSHCCCCCCACSTQTSTHLTLLLLLLLRPLLMRRAVPPCTAAWPRSRTGTQPCHHWRGSCTQQRPWPAGCRGPRQKEALLRMQRALVLLLVLLLARCRPLDPS